MVKRIKKKVRGTAGRGRGGTFEEGIFRLLYELAPEVAERETRTITVLDPDADLPVGEYVFAEAFCSGRDCDCRRAFFFVYYRRSPTAMPQHLVTIGYGWESPEFYGKWMKNAEEGAPLHGASIEFNGPYTEHSKEILAVFEEMALSDPAYVDRVKRHYAEFKRRIPA